MTASQLDLFHQPTAAENGKNVTIFQASAGSGKTFTIVKEYLKILLMDPSQYQHILAITFTNEATREMKDRVISELAHIANGVETDYWLALQKDLHGFNLPMEKRATKALRYILHNYSRFEISTIDHFFSRVVRALAWELRLPIKYEIDVDNERAMSEAVSKLFDIIHQNPLIQTWLEDFAFSRLEEDRGWNVEYNLHDLGMELFEEKFHQGFSGNEVSIEDLRDLVKQLNTIRDTFGNLLKDLANDAIEIISSHGLELKDFSYGDKGAANAFFKIKFGDYRLSKRFVNVASGSEDWYAQKSLKREAIKGAADAGLNEIAKQILEHHTSLYGNYVTAVQLLRNIFSYGLLEILNQKLGEYRADNNLMLLSDTAFLLHEMIDKQDAPFIFEKVGSRYHHLVIDEFQDTSNYQWHNLLPMVLNTVSDQNKVFIAGDVKQSIYRWRGGNMNLLIEGIHKDLEIFKDQIQEKELEVNWRSAVNIVEFNNNFFAVAKDVMSAHPELPEERDLVANAYSHLTQKPAREDKGMVRAKFFDYWDEEQRHWTENAKTEVIAIVQKCRDDGFSYKDIMILVDVGFQANELAESLSKENIPVITESSLLVTNSRQVQLILSTLSWFRDPDNLVAKSNVLYSYLNSINAYFDPHEIFANGPAANDLFASMLPDNFVSSYEQIARKPLYEMVEELIITFSMQQDADSFLQRFQDICLEQANRGLNDLGSFLNWWNEKLRRRDRNALRDLSIVTPSESDAITIMTIHRAKGLEAPVVIVPFAGDRFELKEKRNSTFWTSHLPSQFEKFGILPLNFDSSLAESSFEEAYRKEYLEVMVEKINVVYVAFTRARERLYILSVKFDTKRLSNEINSLHKLLYAVFADFRFSLQNSWDEQNWLFQLGEEESNKKETVVRSQAAISAYHSYPYQQRIQIRSDAKKFFLLLDSQKATKIREGVQLHAILERLVDLHQKEQVIVGLVAEGIVKQSEVEGLNNLLESLFAKTNIAKWFEDDWRVMTERSIFDDGKVYRPDRVVYKESEAVVVDYKLEKAEPKHKKQIKLYGGLLSKMGYTKVEMYLVYISESAIVAVQ